MQTPPLIPDLQDRALGSGSSAPSARTEHALRWAFGVVLLIRLLFPFYNSPLGHLWSDPARHWENGMNFLHPNLMGSADSFLYQLWIYLLQQIKNDSGAVVATTCGLLCVAMPYGWYRALKELVPKTWALGGALLMALVPSFIGIYAYFMDETLLLALIGFAFWATFRAQRKRTVAAFAAACALWLAAGFTRNIAWPMGLLCLLSIWLPQPQRAVKAALGVAMLLALLIPACLHARVSLGFLTPIGETYLTEIYNVSGNKVIDIDCGPKGRFYFGSPSFYNPTFYPFSDWTTGRSGTASVVIDTSQGRASWVAEKARIRKLRTFSRLQDYWENFLFLSFGQSWPDNDRNTLSGWLTVWTRWIWLPLILAVAVGAGRGYFCGREWLLPLCGLGIFLYLLVQHEGVMEGRYRKPLEAVFVAAAVVMVRRMRWAATAAASAVPAA